MGAPNPTSAAESPACMPARCDPHRVRGACARDATLDLLVPPAGRPPAEPGALRRNSAFGHAQHKRPVRKGRLPRAPVVHGGGQLLSQAAVLPPTPLPWRGAALPHHGEIGRFPKDQNIDLGNKDDDHHHPRMHPSRRPASKSYPTGGVQADFREMPAHPSDEQHCMSAAPEPT